MDTLACKAVIFDMDGTLIDSVDADYLAWKRLFSDYQKALSFTDYIPLLGIKSAVVAKEYLEPDDPEKLLNALARKLVYFKEIVEEKGIFVIPYADVLVKQVSQLKIPMALATSSRRAKMEMVMQKTGLMKYFSTIVTGEDVLHGKPAPDVFIKTAEKLRVSPADCIVFEDALNGIRAVKSAGMKCVALESSLTRGMLQEADLVVPSFEGLDLHDICARLYK